MLDARKSTHYCYLRYCKAVSEQARLWWLNKHYELDGRERMKEAYGMDRVVQYQEGRRHRV